MLNNLFSGWKFDLKTAVITVLIAPVAIYLLAVLRKFLKTWGAYALEGILYWVSRALRRSLAGSLTLKRYCRLRLAEDNRYLFVPSSLDVKLEVDEVFVTLTLDQQGTQDSSYRHYNILSIGNRLRVIGDPGSGKSSLVKRLFRDSCYQALKKPSRAKLPILIELKHLSVPAKQSQDRLGDWFFQKLRDSSIKSRVYQMGQCFDSYAENSGLIVLLDGLDEVATSNYSRVQAAINGLSQKLSQMSEKSTIVLTMRTQFHQQVKNAYRDCFGRALFLKPFTPTDIYEFLVRWPFRKQREAQIARIYGELTDRPTLREMCSNPLVLAMYVAEDQTQGHVAAPESRTEFYRKVTDELLIKRRLQQIGNTPAHTKLREQRERILGKVVYDHMLNAEQPTNSLDWKAALDVIREIKNCSEAQAEEVLREIAKETGIISEERTGQSYRFIHLTFCEFLAAHEAVQGQADGWGRLLGCHRGFHNDPERPHLRARLLEAIPFACGLLPRVNRAPALSDVVTLQDDALLARCFLETKQYDHASWPKFANRQRAVLLSAPESNWDEKWLRELHLFNVVVKDAQQCSLHVPIRDGNVDQDDFFRTLISSQQTSLSKLLSAYATQDAAAAFRLAEVSDLDLAADFPEIVVVNCDQAPFLAFAIEHGLGSVQEMRKWAPLIAEAALRSPAVASSLVCFESPVCVKEHAMNIPRKKRWFRAGLIETDLYSLLLTIALESPPTNQGLFAYLNAIASARPPGSMRLSPKLVLVFFLLVGAISLFKFGVFFSAPEFKSDLLQWLVILGFPPIMMCFFILQNTRLAYHGILNIYVSESSATTARKGIIYDTLIRLGDILERLQFEKVSLMGIDRGTKMAYVALQKLRRSPTAARRG